MARETEDRSIRKVDDRENLAANVTKTIAMSLSRRRLVGGAFVAAVATLGIQLLGYQPAYADFQCNECISQACGPCPCSPQGCCSPDQLTCAGSQCCSNCPSCDPTSCNAERAKVVVCDSGSITLSCPSPC